jgi:hypothetical protein
MLENPLISKISYLLGGRTNPILWTRNCQPCPGIVIDVGGNQHGFIARQNCLAECNIFREGILRADGTCARFTVRLIGKWLLDLAVVIAVESTMLEMSAILVSTESRTYHIHRIHISGRRWVPLTTNHSWFACVRTIIPRCTRLIWTHGPASILRSWNGNQAGGASWESALPTFLQFILASFLSR